MNYKLLLNIEVEENKKLKQELLHIKARNEELELRLKHMQQPKLLRTLNLCILRRI